jgi:hypothetical protein
MSFRDRWNRRTFLGALAALSSAIVGKGTLFAPTASATPSTDPKPSIKGFGASGDIYKELGVTTVINGQGTMTVLGGSLMRPEVEAVMALAGRHFVSIPDLEVAAGKRIAEMLKLPADYAVIVTSGAAAAMQSGLAGILTGNNPKFIEQLPDLTGMKSEVLIQKSHRNPFRSPAAFHRHKINRRRIPGRREKRHQPANRHDALLKFCQRRRSN